jgi:two-component system cell cycle response regulator
LAQDKTIIADQMGFTIFNSPKSRKSCLIQYSGSPLGKRYNLDLAETIAGRSPENPIVINDPSVSRQHARFVHRGDKVDVEDLGTTNGTYVNDIKLAKRTELRDGDIIRLGNILLKFYATADIESLLIDKIYTSATIDNGTGIFNKKTLLDSLDIEIKNAKAFQRPLSIIYYDLDFFKKVNDTHGHNAGDFILKESARVVTSVIRKDDIFGRFGGEEFIAILPGTDIKLATDLAERIRKSVEAHVFHFDGKQIKQTLSLGVSQITAAMTSAKELLDSADQKLYRSKHEGRNRVTF